MNFWAGRGLTSYDGGLLILWPPLYPLLLGLVHGVFQLEMVAAADAVQIAAFVGLSICLTLLFIRIFKADFVLAIVATVLADVGSVVLITFDTAGSDYLQLFMITAFILLAGKYIETGATRAFLGMVIVGMLAVLNRYLGIAFLLAGVLAILLLMRVSLRKRLWSSLMLSAAAVPGGLWLAITSRLYTRRPPISFAENFDAFSRSILGWFFEPHDVKRQIGQDEIWLWSIVLALVLIVLVLGQRSLERARTELEAAPGNGGGNAYLALLMLFGLCYVGILFGEASTAYFNKLAGRFLLPLYVPLILLPVVAADRVLGRSRAGRSREARLFMSAACYGSLAILAFRLLQVTLPVAIASHSQGAVGGENAFNTKVWDENPAIRYWLSNIPQGDYSLLSNQPDGVAFQTQYAVEASPRSTTGPYGTAVYPLDSYAGTLFRSGTPVYLLWIEPNPCTYCYSVDELTEIAQVEPLSASDAGGVYRLKPK